MTTRAAKLLVAFFAVAFAAQGQEAPCRQRFVELCEIDSANPICKLLRGSGRPETLHSIETFLKGLAPLDEMTRKDLICARLMGKRTVVGLETKIDYRHRKTLEVDRYVFRVNGSSVRDYVWLLQMPSEYTQLVEFHRKLDTLNKSADKSLTLDFEGVIVDVSASYTIDLREIEIMVDSVVPIRTRTPHSSGDTRLQIRAIQEKIKRAYEEYMTTGLDTGPS